MNFDVVTSESGFVVIIFRNCRTIFPHGHSTCGVSYVAVIDSLSGIYKSPSEFELANIRSRTDSKHLEMLKNYNLQGTGV